MPMSGTEQMDFAETVMGARSSPATVRAYRMDWLNFRTYMDGLNASALPAHPRHVRDYIVAQLQSGAAPASMVRRCAAIAYVHRAYDLPNPTRAIGVSSTLDVLKRNRKSECSKRAGVRVGFSATEEAVFQLADASDRQTRQGKRDRALILCGFAAALRRSDLVALDVEHLVATDDGLVLRAPRMIEHARAVGAAPPIIRRKESAEHCPVLALETWLQSGSISSGAIFRRMNRGDAVGSGRLTPGSVSLIVKRLAVSIGLPSDCYASNSLRGAALRTEAREQPSLEALADRLPHISLTVLREVHAQVRRKSE